LWGWVALLEAHQTLLLPEKMATNGGGADEPGSDAKLKLEIE